MNTTILWLRRDLRLHDNPALQAALQTQQAVIPVFIDDTQQHRWTAGSASRCWLHYSLKSLQASLRKIGSDLIILQGDPLQQLEQICTQLNASQVFWNRCYEPYERARDKKIKRFLQEKGLHIESFNGSLLSEPWEGVKKDSSPYRIFTPFWKAMQNRGISEFHSQAPARLSAIPAQLKPSSTSINSLKLLPQIPWNENMQQDWNAGETAAFDRLEIFLDEPLLHYSQERDIPALSGTSRLSTYLHFGQISVWQIWRSIQRWSERYPAEGSYQAAEAFLRQLAWRDFAHHLLYFFPDTQQQPLDSRFSVFPWREDYQQDLQHWQQGRTGIPIIDAGMRELWQTGLMHNRVRMLTASLLTKNLLIPWQEGAKWFWDTLIDADLANNTMGWQWCAGSGADASPYFRIFNPVVQGERFDPHGRYIRQWLPELKNVPDKWIHRPWEAPTQILKDANLEPGSNWPEPIVDLASSRQRALSIWNDVKQSNTVS